MKVFGHQLTTVQSTGLVVAGSLSLCALVKMWMQGPKFKSTKSLVGKTVVITGANTGIGKICAIDMAKRGGKVVILCRSKERGEAALKEIRSAATSNDVHFYQMDLASLASVRACAETLNRELNRIDILLNNAGVMACPKMLTSDGFEMQIGTNHFGHFLLTHQLLPLLRKAAPGARIVNVSSLAHERGKMHLDDLFFEKTKYNPLIAYQQSKLANVLFTRELAVRYGGEGIHSYSLHPGVIATELGRHMHDSFGILGTVLMNLIMPFAKTPESGAQTSLYCCMEDAIADQNGLYYSDCREKTAAKQALVKEDAERLWKISEDLTGVKA